MIKKNKIVSIFSNIENRFSSRTVSIIYVLCSCIFYIILNVIVKLLSYIPTEQIIYQRAISEMILSLFSIYFMRESIVTNDEITNKLLIIRGIMGGLGLLFYFNALYLLPISICLIFFMLTPLWIAIATCISEKKVDLIGFFLICFCIGGMILIIKPSIIWHEEDNKYVQQGFTFYLGVFFSTTTGILAGIVYFTIKSLNGKAFIGTIVFYFNFFNCIFSSLGMIYEGTRRIDFYDYVTILLIGMFGWSAQMLRSRALMIEKVFYVSILLYMQIPLSYLCDVFILKIEMDIYSNLGCLLIVVSMIGLIYLENNNKNN